MNGFLTTTSFAAALALGILGAGSGFAQDTPAAPTGRECIGEQCPGGITGGEQDVPDRKRLKAPEQDNEMRQNNRRMRQNNEVEDQSGDQMMPRKKRVRSGQQDDENVDARSRTRVGEGKWHYDPNRHQRRRSKDATFRFYFGGYWYPEPYWAGLRRCAALPD